MSNPRLAKLFPLFTLAEIQLLTQGIHLIGEQNRVDKRLLPTYLRLSRNLAEALEEYARRNLNKGKP